MVALERIALHRHWLRADAIKYVMFEGRASPKNIPEDSRQLGEMHSIALRLEVFYGLIYVVVEGYKKLEIRDQKVDSLLQHTEYVERLRRFRNAIFHYHKDPLNTKLIHFMDAPDSETWIRKLYSAFEQFFLRRLPIKEKLSEMGWNDASSPYARRNHCRRRSRDDDDN